ncbi:MAG: hypothetical protein ACPHE2_07150, partial [Candidatus Puniceispirillaceae bacterium]
RAFSFGSGFAPSRRHAKNAHAPASLGFAHPVTGEALHFETPMPDDMAGLVAAIEAGIARRATAPKNR